VRLLGLGVALALVLVPLSAAANGSFPAAGQLVVDPADPMHILVRTTFGMVVTRDGGATWGWVCESAALYMNEEPGTAIANDGAIIAGVKDGISLSPDACDWSLAPGIDGDVKDVSVQRDDPAIAVAVTSNLMTDTTRLWESLDHGGTWSQAGVDLPTGFFATTLDVAPSDPMRVYIAGLDAMGKPALARTDNRGQSWTVTAVVTTALSAIPYLGAIDPLNPDIVYVRADADPGRVLVSSNGGGTWTEPFIGTGPMRGFALSPDGQTLLVGDIVGVWRAPTETMAFTQVADVFVTCLTWAAAGVYACSNEYVENFFVGLSQDQGATFAPVLHMFCIPGPLSCPAGTTAGTDCPAQWPPVAMQIGAEMCAGGGGQGGGAAGGGGTGAASGAGPAGPSAGGNAGGTAGPPPAESESCSCEAVGGTGADGSMALWGLVVAAALRRGRRDQARAR
jgi:hypothetical protein